MVIVELRNLMLVSLLGLVCCAMFLASMPTDARAIARQAHVELQVEPPTNPSPGPTDPTPRPSGPIPAPQPPPVPTPSPPQPSPAPIRGLP